MGILGSEHLWGLSDTLGAALNSQAVQNLSPDKRKSDQPLRRFTIREMADLCFRMNYNTLRHYLKTIDGLPEGEMETGNKKTYSLAEIHEIQGKLYKLGKIPEDLWPQKKENEEATKLLVTNLKGGVAKTSTVANLSQFLACRGFRVLIIDFDPQSSCSDLFDVLADIDGLPSIYDVIKYDDSDIIPVSDAIQPTYFENIDIIPGSMNLTEFEYETAAAAREGIPFHHKVRDVLQVVEQSYDVILFDTPPHMSFAVIATLIACNSMLVPLTAGMLDVVSLVKFMELAANTLDQLEGEDKSSAHTYDFIRVILTKYAPHDAAQMQLASFLRSTLGAGMMKSDFLDSTAISDAGNTMNPLLEVDPSSFTRKTYDRIFESLQNIALEIEEEIMAQRSKSLDERAA